MRPQDRIALFVYFEDPFWVAVCQRERKKQVQASRTVFGAEPLDAQVYELVRDSWRTLRFGPALAADRRVEHANPKRRQREAQKQSQAPRPSTQAQRTLALQREVQKQRSRARRRDEKQARIQARFTQKQQKKKQKHKGR